MIDITKLKIGSKVHYQPEHYGNNKWENGKVKEIRPDRHDAVWVVYNCAGDWDNYMNYTSALTNLRDLKTGWKLNMNYKLDTDQEVFFYEQEFYVLSNFSAFQLNWKCKDFQTSEHAYHWEKFENNFPIKCAIRACRSAHDAFKLAECLKGFRRTDWDDVKVNIMREILRAKALQHEYVSRKLLETGDRELIEDSWRDDFWGWGPNKDGKNMLGKLWMEIRNEIKNINL